MKDLTGVIHTIGALLGARARCAGVVKAPQRGARALGGGRTRSLAGYSARNLNGGALGKVEEVSDEAFLFHSVGAARVDDLGAALAEGAILFRGCADVPRSHAFSTLNTTFKTAGKVLEFDKRVLIRSSSESE